jgi:hypothetical protein
VTGDLLVVFLKEPRPRAVKTRLAAVLGAEAAAALYRLLAEEAVRATRPRAGEYSRVLCFTPAAAREAIAGWFPGEVLLAQEGADLGERMAGALAEAFRRGARRAAVVGSDVPGVSRQIVGAAFAALDGHDLAIGPAQDGGYYLLALDQPRPALFQGIPWSTPAVFSATMDRASGFGLSVHVLETLGDLDTPDDLRREWPRLQELLRPHAGLRASLARALGLA